MAHRKAWIGLVPCLEGRTSSDLHVECIVATNYLCIATVPVVGAFSVLPPKGCVQSRFWVRVRGSIGAKDLLGTRKSEDSSALQHVSISKTVLYKTKGLVAKDLNLQYGACVYHLRGLVWVFSYCSRVLT